MRLQNFGQAIGRPSRAAVFFSSVKSLMPSPSQEDGVSAGSDAGSFVFAGEFPGFDFAGFDVGLIEGVDADDGAGNGGGDLPAEKFLAEIVNVGTAMRTTGWPAFSRAATAASWDLFGAASRRR